MAGWSNAWRWVRWSAAIAIVAVVSAAPPVSAVDDARSGARLRDRVLIWVSGLPPAPAALQLSIDRGRASVLSQELLVEPLGVDPEPGGGSDRFSSRATGFTLQATATQTVARVLMKLEVMRPGKPITGRVSVPRGTRVLVAMPDGRQMFLRDGRFSIPTTAVGIGSPIRSRLAVQPQQLRPGGKVIVTGDVGSHCGIGSRVDLTSAAFAGSAGRRTNVATVSQEGAFFLRAPIPKTRHGGRYTIRARCGGSDLGVATHVRVTAHPHGAARLAPDPNDDCAPGQRSTYVCTVIENKAGGAWPLKDNWQSCGETDPGPAQALGYQQRTRFKAECAINFWGATSYDVNVPGHNDILFVDYSTFSGNTSCSLVFGDISGLACTGVRPQLVPVNANASGEGWHYDNYAAVSRVNDAK